MANSYSRCSSHNRYPQRKPFFKTTIPSNSNKQKHPKAQRNIPHHHLSFDPVPSSVAADRVHQARTQVQAHTDPVAVHNLAAAAEDRSSCFADHSSRDLVRRIAALAEAGRSSLGFAFVLLVGRRWADRPGQSTFGST